MFEIKNKENMETTTTSTYISNNRNMSTGWIVFLVICAVFIILVLIF